MLKSGIREMGPASFFVPIEESLHLLISRKPFQKSRQSPFLQTRCPADCHLHPLSVLAVYQPSITVYLELYPSQAGWILKLQTKGIWLGGDLHWSSGEGSCYIGNDAGLSQKGSLTKTQGHGVKHSKEPASRLATLSRCLSSYAEGQAGEMAHASSFLPGEAMPPLSDTLQEGVLSLPVCPGDAQDCTVCPQAICLHSQKSTAVPSGLHTGYATDLLNSNLWDLLFVKTHEKSAPLVPISGFGKVFSLCDSLCTPLVLSCISLWQDSLLSIALTTPFSPKPHLCTSYLPHCGLSSSCSCAVCSVSVW